MDALLYQFPISGVETYLFLPPLVMFVISSLTSMGGLSGAFVLLPFQMSVLGYTAPGVSATNFVYNVVSIPLGVYRHVREGRLAWPLFVPIMLGTVPGMGVGYYVRVVYLPDPRHFQFFAGAVLGYMAVRLTLDVVKELRGHNANTPRQSRQASGRISGGGLTLLRARIDFQGETYRFGTAPVFALALVVGVVAGAYGIGGGAIMAPFCISVLGLPVYVVSGAALLSTWVSSILAAVCYAYVPVGNTVNASPDWLLGALFGLGGLVGIYVGTRLQRWVPTLIIRAILAVALMAIAVRYCWPTLAGLLD